MKFLRTALVLAMALCLTASVYAETQSVKVSGDLTVRGVWRNAYDYRTNTPEILATAAVGRTGMMADAGGVTGVANAWPGAHQSFWMSQAEVQVDADLTDCVSACVRVLNERDWNVQGKAIVAGQNLAPNGLGGYAAQDDEFNIDLDLAYVTLKNFIYQPLTVTIGRQDLWFGKGFIVGSNHVYNNWQSGTGLNAPEYTAMTAFDSVKAVLDYDPWTITGVYANILNNAVSMDDGIDLWGINVGYLFDCYKAEAEAYWFYKRDRSIENFSRDNRGSNDVHTFGVRGSMDPIDTLTLSAEIAGQAGAYTGNTLQQTNRPRAAWALDVAAESRYFTDKFAWKPKLGVEYILYSGNKDSDTPNDVQAYFTGWDPMFRGKFDSAIREFVGTYYASYDYPARANYYQTCADASFTNQSQLIFSGSVQPMDCLTLKGNYNLFWTMVPYQTFSAVRNRDGDSSGMIGQEVDLQAIWDYTEDVSFGVLYALFMPNSDVYGAQGNNNTAQDLVGTVKVSF